MEANHAHETQQEISLLAVKSTSVNQKERLRKLDWNLYSPGSPEAAKDVSQTQMWKRLYLLFYCSLCYEVTPLLRALDLLYACIQIGPAYIAKANETQASLSGFQIPGVYKETHYPKRIPASHSLLQGVMVDHFMSALLFSLKSLCY